MNGAAFKVSATKGIPNRNLSGKKETLLSGDLPMVSIEARTPEQFHPARDYEQWLENLLSGVGQEHNARLLFLRFLPLIRQFFHRRGCPPSESEDLAQETFMRVFEGLSSFRRESRFETWLFSIAENVHRRSLVERLAAKRSASLVSLEEVRERDDELPEPDGSKPLQGLLLQERIAQVSRAVSALPAQMRRCVLLRFFQQLHYREIADLLDISVEAVKVQLFRARSRLRREIGPGFGGGI